MINDHRFGDFYPRKLLDQPCNCIPYWPLMVFLWSQWIGGSVAVVPTSAHKHRLPCTTPHHDLTLHVLSRRPLHTHIVAHKCTCYHNTELCTPKCAMKNTHVHILLQKLAVGMAMSTNTPTFSHPLNLHTQKPRVTTSLSKEELTQEL